MNRDRRNVLLCALLLAVAAAAAWPALEMGVNDGWSYAFTAHEFARTGHFIYNGWASPILIPQLLWSALFVKLLGFSFFALRLSTIAIALACVPAVYYLARECGLEPEYATFATLLSILAPVFLPEVVTFMTDVHGFFPFVLCLYAGVRASKAKSAGACAGWCAMVALTGLWSGAVRQVFFAAPILFLPAIAWLKRRTMPPQWPLAAAVATLGIELAISRWFSAQPYTAPDDMLAELRDQKIGDIARDASICCALYLGTWAFFTLPLLAAFCDRCVRTVPRRIWIPVLALAAVAGAIAMRDREKRAPWIGNVVTNDGIFSPAVVALGGRPATLTPPVQMALSLAIVIATAATCLLLWRLRGSKPAAEPAGASTIRAFLLMGAPFAAASIALIALRSIYITVFDRYLIPIIPLFSIPLLWIYQTRLRARIGVAAWSVLAIFALYGVAGTHDLFADGRARLQAIAQLEQRGVARSAILGGFEFDAWTQLELTGYVNNEGVPPQQFREIGACSGPAVVNTWYREFVPDLQPRYFLGFSRERSLADGPFGPIAYSAWLPPRRRTVWVQTLADGSASVCR